MAFPTEGGAKGGGKPELAAPKKKEKKKKYLKRLNIKVIDNIKSWEASHANACQDSESVYLHAIIQYAPNNYFDVSGTVLCALVK